jgi:hypothetical protein
MKVSGVTALIFAAVSSPASAGWQYTIWGMTPQQVVAASGGKVTLGEGSPGDQISGSSLRVGAIGTHSSGKWQFGTVFYFDDNKLALVQAKLRNGQNGCGALWADMKSAYGKPFSEDHDTISSDAIWHDAKKNNFISILEIGDLCHLSYKPLNSADNGGL